MKLKPCPGPGCGALIKETCQTCKACKMDIMVKSRSSLPNLNASNLDSILRVLCKARTLARGIKDESVSVHISDAIGKAQRIVAFYAAEK